MGRIYKLRRIAMTNSHRFVRMAVDASKHGRFVSIDDKDVNK
jgi:hypothetical protein